MFPWKILVGAILIARPAMAACGPEIMQVDGNRIWAHAQGAGPVTVVFESGFGNDATVWNGVEPRIRAAGVRTLVYDRAGMGHSTIDTRAPYSLDIDVHILGTVMTQCGVTGRRSVVLVAHSYGGAIALADAARDPRIAGMVLLDAVVPGVWTEHEVQKNLAAMRPQYEDIRKQAPDLAKVAIPWAEAMPASAREVNALSVPEALPIAEIGAEHGQSNPDSAHTWRAAQLAFVAGHPARRFTLAEGSSHKVMVDKPDLVVDAVVAMVRRVENDAALQQHGK